MSQMTFAVLDGARAIHARRHASFVDVLIPALSDDPETIEELGHAMRRFLALDGGQESLDDWTAGECDEPFEAGLCLVDLAARLIVYSSTFSELLRAGEVTRDNVDPEQPESARWIPYRISQQWQVMEPLDGWRERSRQRRRERLADAPLDTRRVLYGRVAEFLVSECLTACGGETDVERHWTPPAGWQWRELPEREANARAEGRPLFDSDAIAEIHARWLMTPRQDLRGKTPREVLLAQQAELALQLQDREFQWSTLGACPPPLWSESVAYRYGGYGAHEIVLYYDLVRHLVKTCWKLIVQPPPGQAALPTDDARQRLDAARQDWLNTPQPEGLSGKTPAYVIQCERLRVPLGEEETEAMIDCDCPLCQMMAEDGRLVFWHLDGCNMDDDFPFDTFRETREEWEEEQRDRARWEAQFERERRARIAAGKNQATDNPEEVAVQESSPVWERSFSNSRYSDSPSVRLFGLGAHLAELIVDLKQPEVSREWIDALNRDYGNLRDAAADPAGSLVAPVVSTFQDHLAAVCDLRPELSLKCSDFGRQLDEFARLVERRG